MPEPMYRKGKQQILITILSLYTSFLLTIYIYVYIYIYIYLYIYIYIYIYIFADHL